MDKYLKPLLTAVCSTLIALPAYAITIGDNYVGADDHGYGDVIATNPSVFDISSMDVSFNAATKILDVTINTGFAGRAGELFSGITAGGTGVGYGDLFLSDDGWTPFGTSPYYGDDASNGEDWEYVFSLSDRYNNGDSLSGKNGALYAAPTALLSDSLMTGGTFRNGQEVIMGTGRDTGNTGTWGVNAAAGQIFFSIDLSGTSLATADTIGLHWAMTCANDVIEGGYPVPEPSIVLLLGSGLIGLALIRKKMA